MKVITDTKFKLGLNSEAVMGVWNRPKRAFVFGVLWILALVVTACESTTQPADELRLLGRMVEFDNGDPRVVVPSTVQAGVEFVVEVTTQGDSCFSKGETEVTPSGSRVVITPYDYLSLDMGICFDIEVWFVHQATVEFSEPGIATVVIQGFAHRTRRHDVVEITRVVEVLP